MYKHVIGTLIREGRLDFLDYFRTTIGKTHEEGSRVLYELMTRGGSPDGMRVPIDESGLTRRGVFGRLVTIAASPSSAHRELHAAMIDGHPLEFLDAAEAVRESINRRIPRANLRSGDVLIDIPRKGRDRIESGVLVYLDRDPTTGRDLLGEFSVSPMLRSLKEDFESNVKKCRVFVRREPESSLEPIAAAQEAAFDGLRGYYGQ